MLQFLVYPVRLMAEPYAAESCPSELEGHLSTPLRLVQEVLSPSSGTAFTAPSIWLELVPTVRPLYACSV